MMRIPLQLPLQVRGPLVVSSAAVLCLVVITALADERTVVAAAAAAVVASAALVPGFLLVGAGSVVADTAEGDLSG